jgi:hypothetical protein
MPQVSSFFELAALLIPVLMLSGYATQRLRPTPLFQSVLRGTETPDLVAAAIIVVVFGVFPALAEGTALSATMAGGEASEFDTWLVGLALALGTWWVAGSIVWPWLSQWWRFARPMKAILMALFAGLFVSTGYLLRSGVELQQSLVDLERARVTVPLKYDTLLAQSEASEAALRDLLDRLVSVGEPRGRLHARIERQITSVISDRMDMLMDKSEAEEDLGG